MGKVGSSLEIQNLEGEAYLFPSKQIKKAEMAVTPKHIASILCVHLHAWCFKIQVLWTIAQSPHIER